MSSSTAITQHRASLAPAIDSRSSGALAAARNLLSRDYPAQPEFLLQPLPVGDRQVLEQRRSMLEGWLRPAHRDDYPRLTKAIAEMLGAFPAGSSGSEKAVVAKWLQVVSDLPAWAILQACATIEKGEADGVSLDYRPSAPRLRSVARACMVPWLEEAAQVRKVLTAEALEPEDAAMRKRVGALLRDLASDLRGTARAKPPQHPEAAAE